MNSVFVPFGGGGCIFCITFVFTAWVKYLFVFVFVTGFFLRGMQYNEIVMARSTAPVFE